MLHCNISGGTNGANVCEALEIRFPSVGKNLVILYVRCTYVYKKAEKLYT